MMEGPVEDSLARLWRYPVEEGLALLFPGQGSQRVGMAQDLYQEFPAVRSLFQQADGALGLPLSRLIFEGPAEELTDTANAQPAIFLASLACLLAALETGAVQRRPAFVAGHSLGEYTALVAAGALDFVEGLRLVRRRGELMAAAGRERPGTMAAIMGLEPERLAELCRRSGAEVCNYNSPQQTVIGGSLEAVEEATRLAREAGGRAMPLQVSGAFHTSLMAPAAAELARAIEAAAIRDPMIPVVGNVGARPLATAGELREELTAQLTSPVRWQQTLEAMAAAGVDTFLEVGPGRVLSGLVRRTLPEARAISLDGVESLRALVP
jgi:[acyl-carrier-protein] S-malonyltransferase